DPGPGARRRHRRHRRHLPEHRADSAGPYAVPELAAHRGPSVPQPVDPEREQRAAAVHHSTDHQGVSAMLRWKDRAAIAGRKAMKAYGKLALAVVAALPALSCTPDWATDNNT